MKETGRNDPCPCGSGKEYQQCCQQRETSAASSGIAAADLPAALQAALEHHRAGRLPQAQAIYRQILEAEPDHADALHYLGAIAIHEGKHRDAAELIGRAIRIKPSRTMHYNLGNALKALGDLDGAAESYRHALALKPDYAEAHINLGNTLQAQGKLDEAVGHYRNALLSRPDLADTHVNLGNALKELSRLDEAVGSYQRALALRPDLAEAHYNLGIALQTQNNLDAAVDSYRKALALKPEYAEAHYNLGLALQAQNNLDAAVDSYRKALALKPEYAEAHYNLGQAFQAQGDSDTAIKHYHMALALKPGLVGANIGIAFLSLESGQFEAAQAALSNALEFEPEHPIAWAMLTGLRKMTLEDSDWINIALRLVSQDNPLLSEKEIYGLQFAIGKYYDDTRQYDAAFFAYQQANRIKRQIIKRQTNSVFDRAEFTRFIDAMIATYSTDFMGGRREGASQSNRPVLIVGVPRSGSSLIEQIIATHPDAFGAGELNFWRQQVTANMAAVFSGNYEPTLIAKLATGYEQYLQGYSANAIRIVDKMLENFLFLGLIHTVFPHARIIHAQRNPVDTCLSIHFTNFDSSHYFATSLEDLAYYYGEYARLMQHWRNVLPADRFLEMPYEALIGDQAGWSQRIIEFIGLNWDENCLDFHKTERKVGTASNWQVRQKIYHTSKARWRHYEKHLGPLLGLLDLSLGGSIDQLDSSS